MLRFPPVSFLKTYVGKFQSCGRSISFLNTCTSILKNFQFVHRKSRLPPLKEVISRLVIKRDWASPTHLVSPKRRSVDRVVDGGVMAVLQVRLDDSEYAVQILVYWGGRADQQY